MRVREPAQAVGHEHRRDVDEDRDHLVERMEDLRAPHDSGIALQRVCVRACVAMGLRVREWWRVCMRGHAEWPHESTQPPRMRRAACSASATLGAAAHQSVPKEDDSPGEYAMCEREQHDHEVRVVRERPQVP